MGMTIDKAKDVLTSENFAGYSISEILEARNITLDIMSKYQQLEEFARWVAGEVIDEDMWALNRLSFAELACRKLVKLRIMQESNGEYLYEETESEVDNE